MVYDDTNIIIKILHIYIYIPIATVICYDSDHYDPHDTVRTTEEGAPHLPTLSVSGGLASHDVCLSGLGKGMCPGYLAQAARVFSYMFRVLSH